MLSTDNKTIASDLHIQIFCIVVTDVELDFKFRIVILHLKPQQKTNYSTSENALQLFCSNVVVIV